MNTWNTCTRWMVALVAGLALLTMGLLAQETQVWLHVQVEGEGAENPDVDLPLSVVEVALAMAPSSIISEGQLRVARERGVTVSTLRQMWQDIRSAGDTEFITIREAEETVRVARIGERIDVRIEAPDATMRVELSVSVVNALLSGDGDTLNLAAAIERLYTMRGDIAHVSDGDRQIRVWIDEVAQP